jgi:hypothetical protein
VEDCRDVLCEIEFAAWIAKFATGLRYQLATPNGKGIDFVVEFEQFGNVGVEVKRIREVPKPIIHNEEDGIDVINYTQEESRKFTDHIMKAISQLLPNVSNAVYVKIDSTVHEFYDAGYAINAIVRRVCNNDIEFLHRKKFDSRDHFMEHYRRMSLLVVRSKWGPSISSAGTNFNSNRVWVNDDALINLPENIIDIFRRGDNWGKGPFNCNS